LAWDPVWEEIFSSRAWGKYPSEDLIRFVARNYYRAPDRSKVMGLELGCGPGCNLWFLAREGFAAFGVDGSATAVKQAKDRLDAECPGWRENGEIREGDFKNLPYADESFDFVIDNEAVYANSFDISVEVYSEAARVLKKDGLIFVRTFSNGSWGDSTGKSLGYNAWECSEGASVGHGYARYSDLDDLPRLLERFEIQSTEQITRTEGNLSHSVKEWLVIARKR